MAALQPVPGEVSSLRRPGRGAALAGVLVVWVIGWLALRGRNTLELAASDTTPLHGWLNDLRERVDSGRNSNPLFLYVFNEIRVVIDTLVQLIQGLISQPATALNHPLPALGWLGVVALATYLAWAFGNLKVAVLTTGGLVFLGLQGLWQESMDTLALTLAAVFVSLLVGIPLGVSAGLSDRFNKVVTPVLDFMQTMPTFVYLAPLTLFFLIGPASAVIATLIYAMPPVIRITAYGIRSVPRTTIEASRSLGATGSQQLFQVLLPMARRTIVLGINQTIMAALSMVTIAALIDAPGLGKTVVRALQTLDVGTAFNAGLAIVVMAIVLDRLTTAAGEGLERSRNATPLQQRLRRPILAAGAVAVAVCAYLSYTYQQYAEFPEAVNLGSSIARGVDAVTTWVQSNLSGLTIDFKDEFTTAVIDPVQSLLAESPWWLVALVVLAVSMLVGGRQATVTSAVCLAILVATGVWSDAMVTLAATLVGTLITMAIGVTVGVWMGRSQVVDRLIRPLLDGAATMPAFVYLVPFLALFAATRFTAIAAAVVFAAPVAIKVIADGIRGVPPATVEAALSSGSSTWQMITKVQLPMAREALVLATNQGLIYVLSMVVVGGLVGAGALGFDVVNGFSQSELFGKGLAAGIAIVVLGIMLDRITQAASRRGAGGRQSVPGEA